MAESRIRLSVDGRSAPLVATVYPCEDARRARKGSTDRGFPATAHELAAAGSLPHVAQVLCPARLEIATAASNRPSQEFGDPAIISAVDGVSRPLNPRTRATPSLCAWCLPGPRVRAWRVMSTTVDRDLVSALLAAVRDGVVAHDAAGEVLEVNARFCAMSGFGRDELL